MPDRRHTYDITLDVFACAIRGDGRPVVDGRDAINALAVCRSILESAQTGQRVAVEFIETDSLSADLQEA